MRTTSLCSAPAGQSDGVTGEGVHPLRWATAALLGGGVALAARRRDALSPSGALGAAAVGTAVYGAGGRRHSILLLLFFGSSTALSRLDHPGRTGGQAEDAGVAPSTVPPCTPAAEAGRPGPRRTLAQVLANGGIPAALALCTLRGPSPRLAAAYAGSLAAANADTWATEIGRLSRTTPRMITTGRPAPAGVSGAVTPLGTLASLAGATLIGAAAALPGYPDPAPTPCPHGRPAAMPDTIRYLDAVRIGAAGFAGAMADSLLGATLQAVYLCRICGVRTEDRAHAHGDSPAVLTRVRGLPAMTNDAVNLCASLVGALLGALLVAPVRAGRRP